jgi:hypothetical protein
MSDVLNFASVVFDISLIVMTSDLFALEYLEKEKCHVARLLEYAG